MKILVTGGCGFLGSHVCEHFIKLGWEVVSYDNMTKHELKRTGYDVQGVRDYNFNILHRLGVKLVTADIRDRATLFGEARGCDYIAHCAAQPAMTIALEQPAFDCDVNVQGTVNVLDAARRYEVPVVNCSTIHVYGNGINERLMKGKDRFTCFPFDIPEMAKLLTGKLTPLHASKRAAELYVQSYIDSYGLIGASFRLTGMYGPRQFGGEDHGWVANFAIRTLLEMPIVVYDTDLQVRDILYVTDAARAFEDWYRNPVSGVFNIGGGVERIISIKQCLRQLSRITGKQQSITLKPARRGDLYYFCCDINKAKQDFNWKPWVSCDEGLGNLVGWLKENIELFGVAKGEVVR